MRAPHDADAVPAPSPSPSGHSLPAGEGARAAHENEARAAGGEQPTGGVRKPYSRFRGVTWCKRDRRWIAQVMKGKQHRYLGYFKEELEAARAYDKSARQAFGEWARPNFPTEAERDFAARWYDLDATCRFFGVERGVFKRWVRDGKITGGCLVPSLGGGKRRVFTRDELERLRYQMFGQDKDDKANEGGRKMAGEWVSQEEACAKFGVSPATWQTWERDGLIRCGQGEKGDGPRLYRVREIESVVARHATASPPYPDPDRPGVYRVPLSGYGVTRHEALIDAGDLHLIEGNRCYRSSTIEGFVFVAASADRRHIPLRRLIMGVAGTEDQNVGHKNGDPLDCRRENLHVRTTQQRTRGNCKMGGIKGKPTSSRYKGVTWDKQTKKWRAVIRPQGKGRSLGRFKHEVEAAQAYDAAARRYFGKHAWLNFPQEGEKGRVETEGQAEATRKAA